MRTEMHTAKPLVAE